MEVSTNSNVEAATEAVDEGTGALTVTAILLSYNCAGFVREAVRSVLMQDCEPMHVVVSDDASTDRTVAILEEEIRGYRGPHRVSLRRRAENSGSKSAHLNHIFSDVSGDILVSFDADDVSEAFRVRRIVETFRAGRDVQAVYSSYSLIDADGRRVSRGRVPHPPGGEEAKRWFSRVDAYAAGTTLAVRRDVIDTFGLLDPSINEDIVLPFRASLLGDVKYLDEELVRVRRWEGSLTAAPESYATIEHYRSRMYRGIGLARRQLESRLGDLDRAEQVMPSRAVEFQELREVARASLADAVFTANLVDPSLSVRMLCLVRLIRAGAYRDQLMQHACLALAPNLYLWHKRRAARNH